MAGNVSEVGHVKKHAFTWYQRTIPPTTVQKLTNGTISSVGKNDYECGKVNRNYEKTLTLNR